MIVINYLADLICKLPFCLINIVNNSSSYGFNACSLVIDCNKYLNITKVIHKNSLIINFFILFYFNNLFRKKNAEYFKKRYYREYFICLKNNKII